MPTHKFAEVVPKTAPIQSFVVLPSLEGPPKYAQKMLAVGPGQPSQELRVDTRKSTDHEKLLEKCLHLQKI